MTRPRDLLSALWATAVAVPPVSTGAAAAYRSVFVTLRRLVVGRRVTVRTGSDPVTLTVSELDSVLDVRRLSVGQLDDVQVAATDITWRGSRFVRASAVLHNVHVRPGTPTTVVAAPVHLTLDVPTAELDNLFLTSVPRFAGVIGDDAVARVRLARRPELGHVEVDAEVAGSVLFLRPRAVAFRHLRRRLPARVPAYRVQLPELPYGLQLTGIRFEPGALRLTGTVPQWRMDLSPRHLEHLVDF